MLQSFFETAYQGRSPLLVHGRCSSKGIRHGQLHDQRHASETGQPDLMLTIPDTSAQIHVFGIVHTSPQPHVGAFILQQRPTAVVCETAVTPEHGARPGNIITCQDQQEAEYSFFVRVFCQVASQLQDAGENPTSSPIWRQIQGHFLGEQLAYIAAFATGALLVFGDRPKDITYRRLHSLTTLAQLDEGFSQTCIENFSSSLGLPLVDHPVESAPVVKQIMMLEREAVMLKVAHDICMGKLPQQAVNAAPCKSLVLVVGSAHLPGLKQLWESGHWKELVGRAELASSDIMVAPDVSTPLGAGSSGSSSLAAGGSQTLREAGLRRGLLEAMLRMAVTQEVLDDITQVLGPVPPEQQVAVDAIGEIYGSSRMLLSCLPRDILKQVCCGNGCDLYEVLQPLRDIRVINGGPGYSEEMVMFLRSLNFDLSGPEE